MPFTGPFTHAELRAQGITDTRLRGWLARGEVTRLGFDLFVPSSRAEDPSTVALSGDRAVLRQQRAVSVEAAARHHQLPLPPKQYAMNARPLELALLPDAHRSAVNGLVVPSRGLTALLLARGQGLGGALVALDAALALGDTREELESLAATFSVLPGMKNLLRAVERADGRSGSPLESLSRGAMHVAKIPAPELQTKFTVETARYFVDFFWRAHGVIGEADGLLKYEDRSAISAEKRRQGVLELRGYRVLRWTWSDVEPNPHRMIQLVRQALGL